MLLKKMLTMILTGELKDKVSNAETLEEKKKIIAEAGMELTDDELENVAGGISQPNINIPNVKFKPIIEDK